MLAFSFFRRGQDAAQQAESRHLEDRAAAQNGLEREISRLYQLLVLTGLLRLASPRRRKAHFPSCTVFGLSTEAHGTPLW